MPFIIIASVSRIIFYYILSLGFDWNDAFPYSTNICNVFILEKIVQKKSAENRKTSELLILRIDKYDF